MKIRRPRFPFPARYVGRHRRRRSFTSARWSRKLITAIAAAMCSAVLVAVLAVPALAAADTSHVVAAGPKLLAAPASIEEVVNNIRGWLIGILAAVATFFLTLGGLRYIAANGDPGEVEKAKSALKSAAIGYALAGLAPLIVTIVGEWVK